ncbi:MAG: glutaredoxin family protein [Candidatus Levybacteria bacterium]|nr:glutaredoxin family protein [Candidatus Levybacteria bacterium]
MNIEIYTKPECPFCIMAKQFLNAKNLQYTEKVLGVDIVFTEFVNKFQSTVPAILINDNIIGGYDQMLLLYSVSPEVFDGGN